MVKDAILLVAHGSRSGEDRPGAEALAEAVRRSAGCAVGLSYTELASPDVTEGLDLLAASGVRRIVVVTTALLAAGHLKSDIPEHITRARARHPQCEFFLAPPLGMHPLVLGLLRERGRAAADRLQGNPPEETAVILVGRGSSDPDANSDLAKLARLFAEGHSYRSVETAYVGVTKPDLPTAIAHAMRLEPRSMVVIPCLVLPGAILGRIGEEVGRAHRRYPWVPIAQAEILGPDPRLVEVVLSQVAKGIRQEPIGRCDVCKYQAHLPGFEKELGGVKAARRIAKHRQLADADKAGAVPHAHPWTPEHHVLVCVAEDCGPKGGRAVLESVRQSLRKSGLSKKVIATPTLCLGRCGEGPMAAVYPEGVWYKAMTPESAQRMVESHLVGGKWLSEHFDLQIDA